MTNDESQNSIRTLEIPKSGRTDRLLKSLKMGDLATLSGRAWKQVLAQGWVQDKNGKELKAGDNLSGPTTVTLTLPVAHLGIQTVESEFQPLSVSSDRSFMVFNKRVGVPCYPKFPWESGCEVNFIAAYLEKEKILSATEFGLLGPLPVLEGGLVHRLDNNTSGLLVVALTSDRKQELRELFSSHTVEKTYLALVLNKPNVDDSIKEIYFRQMSAKRMKAQNTLTGLDDSIRTGTYRATVLSTNDSYSLIQVNTSSGIRHQIRAYMEFMGAPLVGDFQYQSTEQQQINQFEIKCHQLHTYQIKVGDECFKVDPPDSFLANVDQLGLYYRG